MSQKIYFSGVGEPDLWNSRFLTGLSKQMLGFLTWDATPALAQAAWGWPEPWQPLDEAGCSIALVNDLKALEAYEAR